MITRQSMTENALALVMDRLKSFHINGDMEAERCALGRICLGEHYDTATEAQAVTDGFDEVNETTARPSGSVGVSIDKLYALGAAERRDYLHRNLLKLYVDHIKGFSDPAYRMAVIMSENSVVSERVNWRRRAVLSTLDDVPNWNAILKVGALNELLASDILMVRASEDHESEIAYIFDSIRFIQTISYVSYLKDLGALDEALAEVEV